jgi:hypothetical protein
MITGVATEYRTEAGVRSTEVSELRSPRLARWDLGWDLGRWTPRLPRLICDPRRGVCKRRAAWH